tara:strand:- start:187 stop:522 length:336 start_codon:yes stop_codon:yes gene_type:complete
MKKLLLILLYLPMISFNNLSYASFPVIEDSNEVIVNYNDPINVVAYIQGILFLTGFGFAIYYLHRLYINSFNPWLRFLGVFGVIAVSTLALLGIFIFIILASENFDIGMGG